MTTIVLQIAIPWVVFGVLCFWAIQRGRQAKLIYLAKLETARQKAERDSQTAQSQQRELFPGQRDAAERATREAMERSRSLAGAAVR